MQLDSLGNEAGEAFENLFKRETPINEKMGNKIKDNQKEIVDALVMTAKIDRAIKFEKQEVLLSSYSTILQELISFFII
jgi:hypothetical protein